MPLGVCNMPALLELQREMRNLLGPIGGTDAGTANRYLCGDPAVLDIYRNTIVSALTHALQLSYPAVQRLVGADFFEACAYAYITRHAPAAADLNGYGALFDSFLDQYTAAAVLPYLPDVARLEWAVNRALHAPDASGLDLARLAALDNVALGRVRFVPHPALTLVHAQYPVDAIWRAVLAQDDAALAALQLGSGPVWLLVERTSAGTQVLRMPQSEWEFAQQLFAGAPLHVALATNFTHAATQLAQHIHEHRLVDFTSAAVNEEEVH
jgi:hypothetical protein